MNCQILCCLVMNSSYFKCIACTLYTLLYYYTYCMTVANFRGKRETAHFAFNTNFLYQCVLHNSTPTPRGNTAPTRVLIIMWIIVVWVCVYWYIGIGMRAGYVTAKRFESYIIIISNAKPNKKYIICVRFEGTS